MAELSSIQKYYENANVFITGVTGFIGKYLMEKLLRSCSQLDHIYVLLRPKKNKSIEERFEILLQDLIFARLKNENPNFRNKLVIIPGDLKQENLGISMENRQRLIDSVHVVFHSAANVNFNLSIPEVVRINVMATRELLLMARQMHKLKAFVYISTAYSNCNQRMIGEKVYELKHSCDRVFKLIESVDEEMIEKITPMLIQDWPNTYAFSKALAEDCVNKYGHGLPVCIVRPSIVESTANEPIVGWTDNINGVTGHCFAFLTGYMRVSLTNLETKFDIVPADFAGNFILATPWDLQNCEQQDQVKVYNYVSGERNPVYSSDLLHYLAFTYGPKCPTTTAGGYYFQVCTRNIYMYKFFTFFLHIVPAAFLDLLLKLRGEKPKAIKLYEKAHKFMVAISYFTTHTWTFEETNTLSLLRKMDTKDRQLFQANIDHIVWKDFLWNLILGVRKYLLKEDPSTIPAGIGRQQKLKIIHYTIISSLCALLFYVIYKFLMLFI